MRHVRLLFALSFLLLLPLVFLAMTASGAAGAAAPGGTGYVYCNRTYLPSILNQPAAPAAPETTGAQPAPQGAVTILNECNGFPDFNGDGYADLAVGVPHKDVQDGIVTQVDAGIVQVVYGSHRGLNTTAGERVLLDQIWHRGLGGTAALGDDRYGAATIAADFNADGYDDLAVGIPGAHIAGQGGAGAVQVIYGSADGLAPTAIQEWSHANFADAEPAAGDGFGTALTAGDFDGNGHDDLAIGVPGANVNGDEDAGAVRVIYGRQNGLSQLRNELLTQDTPGFLASPAEPDDQFGFALAAGDFDGDGVDDLAVGTPYEDNGVAYVDAGAVQVFFGHQGNLTDGLIVSGSVVDPQHWRSDSSAYLEGAMEELDRFGFSLAAADFNRDGYDDLAVGIPFETHGSGAGAHTWGGALNVLYGGETGLEVTQDKPAPLWHQDRGSMLGTVESLDLFGWSLAAGSFNGDAYPDLAVGVPADVPFTEQTGAVQIMFGAAAGLGDDGNMRLADVDNPQSVDSFGLTVSGGDFNGDGYVDLAVGAPNDEPTAISADNTGSVFVYFSNGAGPQQTGNQNWYPGNLDMRGTPEAGDSFGRSLPGSPRR